MLIIGTHFFAWGSVMTAMPFQCGRCGQIGPFTAKKGMRFLTLFFVIPVCPLSGITHMLQCTRCGARYEIQEGSVALAVR